MTGDGWALRTEDLRVRHGDVTAVDGVHVHLVRGAVTALVGPNGSGKSTLLRAMSRLVVPSEGRVSLPDVRDVTALGTRELARRVGLLAQHRPTPAGITVRDVVGYGRHPHRRGWRGTDPGGPAAVDRALLLTGLADRQHLLLETLSGGQLQRAWVAAALAQDTEVLLLDEPINHLDLRYQVEVLELVRSLADRHHVAVGVVLHDLDHAAEVADRVVVLSRGRVVADGPPAQALTGEVLSEVYEIPVRVTTDPEDGALRVRARPLLGRTRDLGVA
ncbi:ABC transporter ATP-binding protein [Pseudokineococcus sp. 1T1Z-3]|uniref:ABC transporter ATP-binding protein n=1 Tax=Pseudokineococcus sp. 1T1Z-3 TaxID=3132745 RepID=UPI003099A442